MKSIMHTWNKLTKPLASPTLKFVYELISGDDFLQSGDYKSPSDARGTSKFNFCTVRLKFKVLRRKDFLRVNFLKWLHFTHRRAPALIQASNWTRANQNTAWRPSGKKKFSMCYLIDFDFCWIWTKNYSIW